MGSVIDYFDCPNCGQEAVDDFYYKTGEQYINCISCGYHESHSYKRDDDGKFITKDGTSNYSFDNLIMEVKEYKNPYGAYSLKISDSFATQCGTIRDKKDYDEFVSDIVSLTNQDNTIESCIISRLVDGNIVKEVLVGNIYYFDDWVNEMLNHSDYSEKELLDFEEHYQNLLTFDENSDNFEKHLNN